MNLPIPAGKSLLVVEGVESTFSYHLQIRGEDKTKALCGHTVFSTQIPYSNWGTKSHLREKWCDKCQELAAEILDDVKEP